MKTAKEVLKDPMTYVKVGLLGVGLGLWVSFLWWLLYTVREFVF